MTTPSDPGPSSFLAPSDALLATQLRTLFHLHRAWGHDLRAPLNNLTLITELLRAEIDAETDPAQLQARVKTIKESTERMTRMLESFLALHAPLGDGTERCDLRALVLELATWLAPEARRRRIAIRTQLPAEEIHLRAVRDRLRQGCLTALVLVLESIPTGAGELEIALAAEPSAIQLAARGLHREVSPETTASASHVLPERPSGITLGMARALIAALGGELREDGAGGSELALAILLPRS